MPDIDLSGKSIIVTGAGSGLGETMAIALAQSGAKVLAFDIASDRLEETVSKAGAASKNIYAVTGDVRGREDCERVTNTAISELGGVTGLVNCAGIGMPHMTADYIRNPVRFWQADPDRWQDVIDVNIRGPFLMARAATPHMLENKWGRIVNVTTSFNTMIRRANMPYGQSKASLEAASNSWAEDLEGSGVTCNVLVPGGAADTRLIPDDSPYERSSLVNPAVMIAPIRWLMSDLSDGITGMRFIGRFWDPDTPWQDAVKKAGAAAAWPELAAEAAKGGQPVPKGGFQK